MATASNSNTKQQRDAIEQMRQAYARFWEGNPTPGDLDLVRADMARFCRADMTAFHPDPRVHAMLEGRREVWLRMQQMATLSTEEIITIRHLEKAPR